MPEQYTTDHERQAYELGVQAATDAASWVIDGNTSADHIRRVLAMLDDGDPEADDYLPAPDLSGEWAGAPTPDSLYEEIIGENLHDATIDAGLASETLVGSVADAIADAWEAGVSHTFTTECERILRAALPEPADLDAVLTAYVECAIWSSSDEQGEPLDRDHDADDLAPETLASMREDVCAFLSDPDHANALDFWRAELGSEQVGHDFWLTRNGHGAGFWDRFMAEPGAGFGRKLTDASRPYGSCDLYIGDDGRIYAS
jgi:hypothetical protein